MVSGLVLGDNITRFWMPMLALELRTSYAYIKPILRTFGQVDLALGSGVQTVARKISDMAIALRNDLRSAGAHRDQKASTECVQTMILFNEK